MTADEAETLYQQRYEHYARGVSGMGLDAYDMLVPVGGVAHWTPLPAGDFPVREVMAKARAYAAANNSSAFLVWYKGRLVEQSYFGGAGETTPITSKSLAKPIAVMAVGRAIALGKIRSLDQAMADFIPEWRGTSKQAITIRQVLGMRSGLLPQGAAPGAGHILNRAYLHPYHDRILINDYPLVDRPGARYEYSNANGDLVALLIERATGVGYGDWIAQELFRPIGARGGQVWMDRPGGTPHSGCCILLPAETYLRLAVLLVKDGEWDGMRLLPKGFVGEMRTARPQNPHAGLGVYLGTPYAKRRGPGNPDNPVGAAYHSEPYLADDLFLFDGNSNQVAYIVPSRELVILRTGAAPRREPEWDNSILPNLLLRAVP